MKYQPYYNINARYILLQRFHLDFFLLFTKWIETQKKTYSRNTPATFNAIITWRKGKTTTTKSKPWHMQIDEHKDEKKVENDFQSKIIAFVDRSIKLNSNILRTIATRVCSWNYVKDSTLTRILAAFWLPIASDSSHQDRVTFSWM